MGISHFHLFFWNHKTDLNQTWQKCSLDSHIQDFWFWRWSEIQHAILNFRSANDSQFSTGPPNDRSCKVPIQLAWWFLTRRFLKFQPMRTHYGPWQPCWISKYQPTKWLLKKIHVFKWLFMSDF
jgi:hypothetical protein